MEKACFSPDGVCCGLARLHVTFGGSGGMITTARTELPYPCFPGQVSGRDFLEGGGGGSNVTGWHPLVEYVGASSGIFFSFSDYALS